MPNIKSFKKSAKKSLALKAQNDSIRNQVRNLVKKFERAIEAKEPKQIRESFSRAQSAIFKASSRGVFHKNKSSRKISRLNLRAKKALEAQKTVSESTAK